MKNRFIKLISLILVCCLTLALILTTACRDKIKPAENSSSAYQSSYRDSSSSQSSVEQKEEPPVLVVETVDRSNYTVSNLVGSLDEVTEDDLVEVVRHGVIDYVLSFADGYMVGDLFNSIVDVMEDYAVQTVPGLKFDVLKYAYCTDGNWYSLNADLTLEKPVHKILNAVLCYKVDGSEKLAITQQDVLFYGNLKLADLIFEGNAKGTIYSIVGGVVPVVSKVLDINVAQLYAIANGTDEERFDAIVAAFGDITVYDVCSLVAKEVTEKASFAPFKDLTFGQILTDIDLIKDLTSDAAVELIIDHYGEMAFESFKATVFYEDPKGEVVFSMTFGDVIEDVEKFVAEIIQPALDTTEEDDNPFATVDALLESLIDFAYDYEAYGKFVNYVMDYEVREPELVDLGNGEEPVLVTYTVAGKLSQSCVRAQFGVKVAKIIYSAYADNFDGEATEYKGFVQSLIDGFSTEFAPAIEILSGLPEVIELIPANEAEGTEAYTLADLIAEFKEGSERVAALKEAVKTAIENNTDEDGNVNYGAVASLAVLSFADKFSQEYLSIVNMITSIEIAPADKETGEEAYTVGALIEKVSKPVIEVFDTVMGIVQANTEEDGAINIERVKKAVYAEYSDEIEQAIEFILAYELIPGMEEGAPGLTVGDIYYGVLDNADENFKAVYDFIALYVFDVYGSGEYLEIFTSPEGKERLQENFEFVVDEITKMVDDPDYAVNVFEKIKADAVPFVIAVFNKVYDANKDIVVYTDGEATVVTLEGFIDIVQGVKDGDAEDTEVFKTIVSWITDEVNARLDYVKGLFSTTPEVVEE